MQNVLKLSGTMRAVAIAVAAAIVTSVLAMLVPVRVFEGLTGATGISEIFPATGAPLGDTARATIAFLFGLLAFAVTAMILLRKPTGGMNAAQVASVAKADKLAEDGTSFVTRMKARISDFAEKRRKDGVTELSDLPKLRTGDAHPDAPPRRPISANTDFALPVTEPEVVAPLEPPMEPVAEPQPVVAVVEVEPEPMTVDASEVASMVERLEAAISARQDQMAKLEALVQAQAAMSAQSVPVPERVEAEIVTEPQPRLEAVPNTAKAPDEMDAALRSALETLHRMTARNY
jgi:hypothetical protein